MIVDASLEDSEPLPDSFDYIVVGSGAGGGPLAANLAKLGYSVLLMEAGGADHDDLCEVPCFHSKAAEDPRLKWDYYVHHYSDPDRQRQDSKFVVEQDGVPRDGILYPRAGTIGGCTVHNAMFTVYPQNSDWDYIAKVTGDPSWASDKMRLYFERLERCHYYPGTGFRTWFRRALEYLRILPRNAARHGFTGWLSTNVADPWLAVKDPGFLRILRSALEQAFLEGIGNPLLRLNLGFDPNDWRLIDKSPEGVAASPLSTSFGKRCGPRDLLFEITDNTNYRLTILTHALAARVILDDGTPPKALGVEYLRGNRLYRADPRAFARPDPTGPRQFVRADREVILCAGTFNTPQLLKLSGIGPRDELERFEIPVRVDLKGVGENLQDRYEVGVISKLKQGFHFLKGATFESPGPDIPPDPFYIEYQSGKGMYTTNGALISIVKRSRPDRADPDLYVFAVPTDFRGYYPGYSKDLGKNNDDFTWAILKAHTNNTSGYVRLRSSDPRDTAEINFRYFDEGNDESGEDLESVVEGVLFVRRMNHKIGRFIAEERWPGPEVQTRDQIREFIKKEAWGHHASCSCKIGADDDPMAVLDSRFRVRGVANLRVVDASAFPRIPGMFIMTSIYMISEKACDAIVEDAKQTATGQRILSGSSG